MFRKTTDHREIQRWVESHGGRPTAIRASDGDVGVLRFDYELKESTMQPISWDEFFDHFEKRKLAFVYEESTPLGSEAKLTKLVSRGS